MAKANKKAKAAAPKKAVKGAKAAAPKKAAFKGVAPKKGGKAAAPKKGAALKKGGQQAAPKKGVAAKKGFKAAAGKKTVAPKKAAAKKATPKKSSRGAAASDQRPMLEALFIDHLKDIYFAEKHLQKALGKMSKAATSPELKQAFEEHQQQTDQQLQRLEQVFQVAGKKAQGKRCDAMVGLVSEAESVIQDTEKGTKTRDVGLIIAAQKAEHYEIASYGGLATLARVLGMEEAKNLLGATLDEEKQTDERLTQLAENNINEQAEQEGGMEETEDGEDEDGGEEEGIELDKEEQEEESSTTTGGGSTEA